MILLVELKELNQKKVQLMPSVQSRAEGLFSCANDAVMTVCPDFTPAREVHYLAEIFPVKIFKEVPIE